MNRHNARLLIQTIHSCARLATSRVLPALAVLTLGACMNMSSTTPQATPGPSAEVLSKPRIAEIVASPDRSTADKNIDLRRKPEQMLSFIGVRPGMVVLDLSAGGGYSTELLARAVGPKGQVYGQSAPPRASDSAPKAPITPEGNASPPTSPMPSTQNASPVQPPSVRRTSAQALAERAKNPILSNMFSVVQAFEAPVPPALAAGGLDLVTFMFNYHDLGHMGVDRAKLNKAVFAGLKSGAMYVIADHAGKPGTGISESGTLHRIDEEFLIQEVQAAGFKLAERGTFLRNPADPRDKNTPEPPQPKDEFVFKFIKP